MNIKKLINVNYRENCDVSITLLEYFCVFLCMLLPVYSIYYIFVEILFDCSIKMLLYFILHQKILLLITLVALSVVVRSWQQGQVLQKQIHKYTTVLL